MFCVILKELCAIFTCTVEKMSLARGLPDLDLGTCEILYYTFLTSKLTIFYTLTTISLLSELKCENILFTNRNAGVWQRVESKRESCLWWRRNWYRKLSKGIFQYTSMDLVSIFSSVDSVDKVDHWGT